MHSFYKFFTESRFLSFLRLLVFTLVCMPLIYWSKLYYPFVHTKTYFFLALSEIAFFSLLWFLYRFPSWMPRFSSLHSTVFIFVCVQFVALLFGVNPLYSFWGGFERATSGIIWLHLLAFFIVVITVFPTLRDIKKLCWVSSVTAVVVSCVFLLSLLFPDAIELFRFSKNGSTLGNSSFLGAYLVLQFGLAGYLAMTENIPKRRFLAQIISIILAFALLFTTAQGAKLAFLGGCILFLSLFLFSDKYSRLKRTIGALLLTSLIIIFFLCWFLLFQPESQVREFVVLHSSETRFILWDIAWQGVNDRPFFGWGPENYQDVFQAYYNPCLGSPACGGEIWFDSAHNKILDVLVESGVFGLISYLTIFVVSLRILWKIYRSQVTSSYVSAFFVSILAAYFVQNLTVFDTLTSNLSFLLLLILVSSIAKHSLVGQKISSHSKVRKSIFCVITVTAIIVAPFVFSVFVISPFRGSYLTKAVTTATTLPERNFAYAIATTLSRQGIDSRRSILASRTATFIWNLDEVRLKQASVFLQDELRFAEQGLLKTVSEARYNLRAYLDLGMMYQTWARFFDAKKIKNAEVVLLDAVRRFPQNPLPYWGLVFVYLESEDVDQALLLSEQALKLDPMVRASILRRLITLKLTNQHDLFIKYAQQSVNQDPSLNETIQTLVDADITIYKKELLFHYYYDAAF